MSALKITHAKNISKATWRGPRHDSASWGASDARRPAVRQSCTPDQTELEAQNKHFTAEPMAKKKSSTGRGMKGGGKSRTSKDFRTAAARGIVKGRWDDICAAELNPDAMIQGKPQVEVIAAKKELDPDKPGLGQFYCVACCKYFINQKAIDDHQKQPKHKRRLKVLLTEKPYSHAEANGAAGRGATDHGLTRALPDAGAMEQ